MRELKLLIRARARSSADNNKQVQRKNCIIRKKGRCCRSLLLSCDWLKMALVQSEPSLPKSRPLGSAQPVGKRRCSMGGGFRAPPKRRRRANSENQSESVLPNHFLLGGNIFDPLNLNSLLQQDGLTNQETPQSSPLPPRGGDPVEILVPRDITDPLNLKEAPPRRKRHRHRHSHSITESTANTTLNTTANTTADLSPLSCELNTALTCREDLAPPPQRRHTHPPLHRRRRTTSTCITTVLPKPQPIRFETPQTGGAKADSLCQRGSRRRPRPKRRSRYDFGNCSKFYGFAGCYGDGEGQVGGADPRVKLLEADWFRGKRALDVGCGAGHMTLFIARNLGPAHILGVELDTHLVQAANQNIRHFLSHDLVREERARRREVQMNQDQAPDRDWGQDQAPDRDQDRGQNQDQAPDRDQAQAPAVKTEPEQDLSELHSILASLSFPQSFRTTRGPLCAPLLPLIRTQDRTQDQDPAPQDFPQNVSFLQGDYVCDQEAWPGRGLYDVILCLGVAKWVQLQKGDEGVARLFTRAYQSLLPGGLFLLETQPWTSYCHSKRSSETTFRNFKNLRLKPEKFTSFLTETIGFSSYHLLTRPGNPRPVYLFHKSPASRK